MHTKLGPFSAKIVQRGVLKLLKDFSSWILPEAPKPQPQFIAESAKLCTRFPMSDTIGCTWLSVHRMHNQVTHVHPGTAARAQERTIRLFSFSNQRGAALGVAPVPTSAFQRALVTVAKPLWCSFCAPPSTSNILSICYLMAEISFYLHTPWLLPDLQLWSLINYYSAGNFR